MEPSGKIPTAKHAPPLPAGCKVPTSVWIAGLIALPFVAIFLCCGGLCVIGMLFGDKKPGGAVQQAQDTKTKDPSGGTAEEEKEKVSRANFNKLADRIMISQAQTILGPACEESRFQNIVNVSWQSKDRRCTIRATFEMGSSDAWLIGKSIYGE